MPQSLAPETSPHQRSSQPPSNNSTTTPLFILAMLGSVAWGCYPNILIATTGPANSLTIFNATAGLYGLRIGLWWFLFGFALAVTYQIYVHRAFWGKVRLDPDGSPTE